MVTILRRTQDIQSMRPIFSLPKLQNSNTGNPLGKLIRVYAFGLVLLLIPSFNFSQSANYLDLDSLPYDFEMPLRYRFGKEVTEKWVRITSVQFHPPSARSRSTGYLPMRDEKRGCSMGFRPKRYTVDFSLHIPEAGGDPLSYSYSVDWANTCWIQILEREPDLDQLREPDASQHSNLFGYLPNCKQYPGLCELVSSSSVVEEASGRFGDQNWQVSLFAGIGVFYYQVTPGASFNWNGIQVTGLRYFAADGKLIYIETNEIQGLELKEAITYANMDPNVPPPTETGKEWRQYRKVSLHLTDQLLSCLHTFYISSYEIDIPEDLRAGTKPTSPPTILDLDLFLTPSHGAPYAIRRSDGQEFKLEGKWNDWDNVVNSELSPSLIFKFGELAVRYRFEFEN